MLASFRRKVEQTVKILQENKAKGNTLPIMEPVEAAKALMGLQVLVSIGELVGVDCDIVVEEIEEILKQHPELWASIDELVERKLSRAS